MAGRALKPPTFAFESEPNPEGDALLGITQSEKLLADKSASAEDRAVALSWLIHFVGDIHQPLHCASLFTEIIQPATKAEMSSSSDRPLVGPSCIAFGMAFLHEVFR